MTSIYVPLSSKVADLLLELALREMRHPRQQAALLIVEALRNRNLLSHNAAGAPDSGAAKRGAAACVK